MGARKEVFISATSADLGSYRQVAKEAVLTLGAHPIEETNFPIDYRELQALLARRLDPCDAIIHLVGFYYGANRRPRRILCVDPGRNGNTTVRHRASAKNRCTGSSPAKTVTSIRNQPKMRKSNACSVSTGNV
jgi:hypothetical protein